MRTFTSTFDVVCCYCYYCVYIVFRIKIMSKEAYLRNKVMTKAEFDKMAAVPILWDDDQIPPLVSLGNQKKTVEKASFQSLNQSDVKSVYTVDREDFGKNMLELINSSSSLQKENKTDRTEKIAVQPVVITDSK